MIEKPELNLIQDRAMSLRLELARLSVRYKPTEYYLEVLRTIEVTARNGRMELWNRKNQLKLELDDNKESTLGNLGGQAA